MQQMKAKKRKSATKLTAKSVDKLLRAGVPGKHVDGGDGRVKGLMLDIRGPNAASGLLRYQLNHKVREMGLGSAREFTWAEMRERARRARQQLADRIDPLQVRRAERATAADVNARRLTFAEAAKRWHEAMRPGWTSAKHAANVADSLAKWAVPIIGGSDVGELETANVLRVLQQPLAGRTLWTLHPTTADRLRNHIKLVLDWAAVAGHRPQNAPNPARWAGHLAMVLPAPSDVAPVQNHPALAFQRIPELMAKLASREGVGAAALRFTILESCRISEAANARWDEIDLEEAVWTVPASRMKARKEWRQPLPPQAVELLKSLSTEAGNPYVFLGSAPGEAVTDAALRVALRREGCGDVVAHGFRSSFSTWAHERTAHANHAIELSLAHSVGNETERAYRRGDMFDKRRKLMEDWARFCTSPPVAATGDVVAIGSARR